MGKAIPENVYTNQGCQTFKTAYAQPTPKLGELAFSQFFHSPCCNEHLKLSKLLQSIAGLGKLGFLRKNPNPFQPVFSTHDSYFKSALKISRSNLQ